MRKNRKNNSRTWGNRICIAAFLLTCSLMLGGCGVKKDSKWKNFFILFKAIDSTSYSICLSLEDIPAEKSIVFFKYNDFYYWLHGEIPPNIISKTKTKKTFSYNEPIPAFYDPPFWTLIYHIQTGNIEFKGQDCH